MNDYTYKKKMEKKLHLFVANGKTVRARCRVPYICLLDHRRRTFLAELPGPRFEPATPRSQVLSYPARIPLDQIVCPDLPEAPSTCWKETF